MAAIIPYCYPAFTYFIGRSNGNRLPAIVRCRQPRKRHPLSGLNRLAGRFAGLQGAAVRRLYGRAPEDTFTVSYRANTAAELQRLARFGEMHLAQLEAISDPTYPAFRPFLLRLAGRLESRLAADRGIHLVGHCRRQKLF